MNEKANLPAFVWLLIVMLGLFLYLRKHAGIQSFS